MRTEFKQVQPGLILIQFEEGGGGGGVNNETCDNSLHFKLGKDYKLLS